MKKTVHKNGNANVQFIVKKILGLENTRCKDLTCEDLKNMWAVQSCFRRTCETGRIGRKHGYHYGKGMDLIVKYFAQINN